MTVRSIFNINIINKYMSWISRICHCWRNPESNVGKSCAIKNNRILNISIIRKLKFRNQSSISSKSRIIWNQHFHVTSWSWIKYICCSFKFEPQSFLSDHIYWHANKQVIKGCQWNKRINWIRSYFCIICI